MNVPKNIEKCPNNVPKDVAVCPECEGELVVDFFEWDADSELPTKGGLNVDCVLDEAVSHRYWQCDWQPIIDKVEEWCGAI